ncbi:helix-turn-helix domain-containing protein [Devosia sp. SL43]|uniref:LexA family protein n=1 Tax=Devosia sp. SL43 TaxID=2806348 RepID=UPI001F02903C|nr:helix-turn-helix domain-containing protein [Devosia sp. SL43]UJW87918.1 helix-turn-helix domain-containing protein [Devosia sp. SL43]
MARPDDISPAVYEWAEIFTDEHIHTDDRELVARAFIAGQQSVTNPDRVGLTDRQRKAFDILQTHIELTGGTPPSFRELAQRLGCTTSRAHSVCKQLEHRGLITMVPRCPRSIAIVGRAA